MRPFNIKEHLKEADKGIMFDELSKDPGKYKGRTVLLGGVIIKTENRKDGTILEIYQTELDYYGQPLNTDVSQGRFLAMDEKFLDSEIYRNGRKITVAGVVDGVEVRKLGKIDYQYPYLLIKKIHLWKEELPHEYDRHYSFYRDPLWWDPWYQYSWYNSYLYYQWYPTSVVKKKDNRKK